MINSYYCFLHNQPLFFIFANKDSTTKSRLLLSLVAPHGHMVKTHTAVLHGPNPKDNFIVDLT